MIELQQKKEQGYFRLLPKKEAVKLEETLGKLEKYFLGIRNMTTLPRAIFVIDICKEDICIAEAQRMGVKIFAIVDTDCDPDKVDHPIPGNDDAVRSIRLITSRIATAVLEGVAQREAMLQEQEAELEPGDQSSLSDEELERAAVEGMAMDDIGDLMQQASASQRPVAAESVDEDD